LEDLSNIASLLPDITFSTVEVIHNNNVSAGKKNLPNKSTGFKDQRKAISVDVPLEVWING